MSNTYTTDSIHSMTLGEVHTQDLRDVQKCTLIVRYRGDTHTHEVAVYANNAAELRELADAINAAVAELEAGQ